MNSINKQSTPDEIRDRIISVAYKDASLYEKLSVWFLIRRNPEYKKLYQDYRRTAISVHKIKLEECPNDVVENAFDNVNKEPEVNEKSRITFLFGHPVFAGIIAAIILTAIIITINITSKDPEVNYSQKDVKIAEQQVKSSLALIGKILNNTSEKIEKEILYDKVGKPLKQGFEIINNLFPKGEKQDENS